TPLETGAGRAARECIREVRRLDLQFLGLLARVRGGHAVAGDGVREEPGLAVDRVECRGVVRQRMAVDGAAVAARQYERDEEEPGSSHRRVLTGSNRRETPSDVKRPASCYS